MTVRNLDRLLRPSSVAVIGASDRPGSVGSTVMRNLLAGHFAGSVTPVNPAHATVAGVPAVADVASMDHAPDLAIICTPPRTIPDIVRQLGEKGTRAAVILTAGLGGLRDEKGRTLSQATLDEARPHLLRILGPNCVGLLVPALGLNASFASTDARSGTLAFVSQSGALATAMLEWAATRGIGFSHFISLGDALDVDFGDVLDYLATDPGTRGILLYIESVSHARKFMSAARAAARNKPVIVVKSGRVPEGARAAASHTGALAGADDVYEAAIRRAGMLRVSTTQDLFAAAETLALARPLHGDRLAIMTNGGGPGVMATDALVLAGGRLASLAPETIGKLDSLLPSTWSGANPVDIIGDAPAGRYAGTMDILVRDPGVDAILLIHAPTAIVSSEQIASACLQAALHSPCNVLSCWLGGASGDGARQIFRRAGLPVFDTPEEAVRAFQNMADFRRNQELLWQTPSSAAPDLRADVARARTLINAALRSGSQLLAGGDAREVLRAYGIASVPSRIAGSVDLAVEAATEIGYPVALKILSPDISHKSDVGGVALGLDSAAAIRAAGRSIEARARTLRPDARIDGFTVEPMVNEKGTRELIVGIATDPTFGPVILFGQGGTAVEIIRDRAVALPPLNTVLAKDLVDRTRIARLLEPYRDQPGANLEAVYQAIIAIAQLAVDFPEIAELDVNPLLAGTDGVLALDVRIRVTVPALPGSSRLAIRPYPAELEETAAIAGASVSLRPIRPQDEPQYRSFIARCPPQDICFRFFGAIRSWSHSQLARFTQIDYEREMAFIALDAGGTLVGEVRSVTDPSNLSAEFAILVDPSWQARGLGHVLLGKMIRYCRDRGTGSIDGEVLPSNERMLALARSLAFRSENRPRDGIVRLSMGLSGAQQADSVREKAFQ